MVGAEERFDSTSHHCNSVKPNSMDIFQRSSGKVAARKGEELEFNSRLEPFVLSAYLIVLHANK